MKILALEFSSRQRSVAVADAKPFRVLGGATETNARGTNGMVLVDRALAEARVTPGEIEVVAVGLGPGSYAGIRSSIAIGQGWQLAREVRLLGIDSVELIAAGAQQRGIFGEVTIVIDAQRHEFYAARFNISADAIAKTESLRIFPAASLQGGPSVLGPDAANLIANAVNLYPTAELLARVAADRKDYRAGEELEPIYLRESGFVKAPPPRFGKVT
jgi:tRNA threonylcarbamoyl adenosine modification protein YeaZ